LKTLPGCGNSVLSIIFLSPDEKGAQVLRAGGRKTLAGCSNSVLLFLYHQMKKRHGFEEQGVENLAGMRKQYLIIFLLPDEKAARVLWEGSGKTMPGCGNSVLYYFSLSPDKKAARVRRAGSAATPGGMRPGAGGPAIRQ
jgi:hypothetical protein